MKYKTDKIAILLATYNGEKYIGEQINSLLSQTYQEWELYIHDDGSKDDTLDVIKKYVEEHPAQIHIIDGPGTGGARNNFFFLMCNIDAPYIMFCDQDDVWIKDKIKKTYDKMIETELKVGSDSPVLVFTDLKVVDQNLDIMAERMSESQKLNPRKVHFKDCLIQNVITGCTTMINRTCLEKSLVEMDVNNVIMHDWWCELVAAYFGEITFVDEALIMYRQHGDNSVGAIPITDPHYIINKMSKGSTIKNALALTRKQAEEFAKAYKMEENSLAVQYSKLGYKRKYERIRFYIENHVWKSGLIRNVGLIVWG